MSLINRDAAKRLRAEVQAERGSNRGRELEKAILRHFDELHSDGYRTDADIERMVIDDELKDLDLSYDDIGFIDGVVMFSPSSASKCPRELFFKACRQSKDTVTTQPYQKRWTRNSTAVHRAVQKDLLYAEKVLTNPRFRVKRTPDGRASWERNIARVLPVEWKGVPFQLYGMMDGILEYQPDGSAVGFEFKTKSTTISAISDFKMKTASPDHITQCSAYSLLFGVDEFLLVYESVAKDAWAKGPEAKPDMRSFYIKVTDADREALLDKFAMVAAQYYNGEIPKPDFSKCMFCPFKTRCKEVGI